MVTEVPFAFGVTVQLAVGTAAPADGAKATAPDRAKEDASSAVITERRVGRAMVVPLPKRDDAGAEGAVSHARAASWARRGAPGNPATTPLGGGPRSGGLRPLHPPSGPTGCRPGRCRPASAPMSGVTDRCPVRAVPSAARPASLRRRADVCQHDGAGVIPAGPT